MVTRHSRRKFLVAATAPVIAAIAFAAPRPKYVPRVGFVSPVAPGPRDHAFVLGLRELGYVNGQNVVVEMRFADGRPERLPQIVDELIRLDVDVLVVGATIGARAAKNATRSIPIVFAGSSDPVAGGIVNNLARPEANVTGFSLAVGEGFAAKWLELLTEAAPGVTRVAAIWSSSNAAARRFIEELEAAARHLHVRLDVHHAANPAELDRSIDAITGGDAQGLIVTPSPFSAANRDKLVGLSVSRRLPAVSFDDEFADAGGLMSYGPSIVETYRQAAAYVDKILLGARPGDLPVKQPTRFALAVNLKTARMLGLQIPQSLLVRADRLIE